MITLKLLYRLCLYGIFIYLDIASKIYEINIIKLYPSEQKLIIYISSAPCVFSDIIRIPQIPYIPAELIGKMSYPKLFSILI